MMMVPVPEAWQSESVYGQKTDAAKQHDLNICYMWLQAILSYRKKAGCKYDLSSSQQNW